MWELSVWVPTKGWRLIKKFRKHEENRAREVAKGFTPLEVKLTSPNGRSYYGGYHCDPNHAVLITQTI